MAFIDYYKVLGVDKTATEEDIKKAFRKLLRYFWRGKVLEINNYLCQIF